MTRVEIYETTYCGYCALAKKLLAERGISFLRHDVTNDPEKRAWLVEKTGMRTVPQIFIDGVSVGGYSELRALDASGELARLLKMPQTQTA